MSDLPFPPSGLFSSPQWFGPVSAPYQMPALGRRGYEDFGDTAPYDFLQPPPPRVADDRRRRCASPPSEEWANPAKRSDSRATPRQEVAALQARMTRLEELLEKVVQNTADKK